MRINVLYDLSDKCLNNTAIFCHRVISPPKIEERRLRTSEQILNTILSIQVNWLLKLHKNVSLYHCHALIMLILDLFLVGTLETLAQIL